MMTLLASVFVFGLVVLVHELGHFVTAKSVGMRVDEFAIGFGPKIVQFRKGETLYSWRAVPLGGFNKIAGMDPDEPQDERSFQQKSLAARMLVIVAGSLMNLFLPVLLFSAVFMSTGINTPTEQAVIGTVLPGKPAATAGILTGDKIERIDGKAIEGWTQFVNVIKVSSGKILLVEGLRDGKSFQVQMIPEYDDKSDKGIVGVLPQMNRYQPGAAEAVGLAVKQTYFVTAEMTNGLWKMMTRQTSAEVAGPIGVAQMAGEVAQLGFIPLLQFAAFLSINLGIINLLPVPMLDGGHILTLAVEGLRGRPLERNRQQFIQMIGFVLLILLFLVATFKDISRLKLF